MKFGKFLDTYDNFATVQRKVAANLTDFISGKSFSKVLELGCGTGLFTRELSNKIEISHLDLNDFFDTRAHLSSLTYKNFYLGDMEKLHFENYDLIVSSSAFQWSRDFNLLVEKISKSSDALAFSIYTEGNLIEIQKHFNISLKYFSHEEILKILKRYYSHVEMRNEKFTLTFSSPLEALKHLKYTGVGGVSKEGSSIHSIKSFKERELTYMIGYFKCYK